MVFSSYPFIFLFLPIVIIVYYALSKIKLPIYQRIFLIAASLFFYGYSNIKHLILIVSSIVVNYVVAIGIKKYEKRADKFFLVIGILFNIALLGYFKYRDFFVENINFIFNADFVIKNIVQIFG